MKKPEKALSRPAKTSQMTRSKSKPKVFVGLSGGVDSSVAAALLKNDGYDVVGVYMKNWTADTPGAICPWAADLASAKRVAVELDIPFKVYDFQKDYKEKVVDYMLAEYAAGRTPNPDIMCNEEIKFKLFLDCALADGADYIATGHYAKCESHFAKGDFTNLDQERETPNKSAIAARTNYGLRLSGEILSDDVENSKYSAKFPRENARLGGRNSAEWRRGQNAEDFSQDQNDNRPISHNQLCRAACPGKDQTYFLYRISQRALDHTLFPLGNFKTKNDVRKAAQKFGLASARRPESMGICFVGEVGLRDFLSQYFDEQPGDIIDVQTGQPVGRHSGAIFYTIGQRHGLNIGGGLPYYVVGKNMAKNQVLVSRNIGDRNFWKKEIQIGDVILRQPLDPAKTYQVRLRHRGRLIDAEICQADFVARPNLSWSFGEILPGEAKNFQLPSRAIASAAPAGKTWASAPERRMAGAGDRATVKAGQILKITLSQPERAVAPGQSAVIYDGEICLGGGVVVG
ncbi:MAG: tRNA-specific 2-thiouridylase [Candidatus Nomurabacteria bacterium]|nr:tRNA-specific 2-thiouridylase [Candidatus Nomurabacteria bacterium]